jgi:hypothetical protein
MTETSARFAITPARAVEDHRLGDAAYRLLACLGTYSDRDGWCWPAMSTVAKRLGVTRQAVQQRIKQLHHCGYLEIQRESRPDGGDARNRYRLLFDRALFAVNIDAPPVQDELAPPASPACTPVQDGFQTNITESKASEPQRTHKKVSTLGSKEPKAGTRPASPEKPVYDLGKQVLGKSAGGQVRKLIRHHGGDLDATERTLHLAAGKSSPSQYVGAILRGETRADDVLAETERLYRDLGVS